MTTVDEAYIALVDISFFLFDFLLVFPRLLRVFWRLAGGSSLSESTGAARFFPLGSQIGSLIVRGAGANRLKLQNRHQPQATRNTRRLRTVCLDLLSLFLWWMWVLRCFVEQVSVALSLLPLVRAR